MTDNVLTEYIPTSPTRRRVLYALTGLTMFTILGVTVPMLYYTTAPTTEFVEVEHFHAPDVTTEDQLHELEFSRTVHTSMQAVTTTELLLVDERAETQVRVYRDTPAFERGTKTVVLRKQLPTDLAPGTYYYIATARVELPYGVTRTIEFQTNRFRVYSPGANYTPPTSG